MTQINSSMQNPELSIVVPVYNEEGNLFELHKRLLNVLEDELKISYEIIFVDDGSKDNSWDIIENLHKQNKNVKGIKFSRNFGQQYALKAGIESSNGCAVVLMDADLQHPPEMAADFYHKWKEGSKIVQAIRIDTKGVNVFKEMNSKIFHTVLNILSDVEIEQGSSDFRLIDRQVVNELNNITENQLFLRGIIPWLGFDKVNIEYVAPERFSGDTKFSFKKMFEFAVNGIMSFSIKPLRISIIFGVFISFLAFVYIIYVLIANCILKITMQGWTSILISILFLGGIQLISIGILGEYIGKLFIENKKRKNYIISRIIK